MWQYVLSYDQVFVEGVQGLGNAGSLIQKVAHYGFKSYVLEFLLWTVISFAGFRKVFLKLIFLARYLRW